MNLIAGRNNVGKTVILEALFIRCGTYNPALAVAAAARRGLDRIEVGTDAPWMSLFWRHDTQREIEIAAGNGASDDPRVVLRAISDPDELSTVSRSLGSSPVQPPGRDRMRPG